jgi:hypothetical protein
MAVISFPLKFHLSGFNGFSITADVQRKKEEKKRNFCRLSWYVAPVTLISLAFVFFFFRNYRPSSTIASSKIVLDFFRSCYSRLQLHTSAHLLQIFLKWLKPPQLRFSYTSSACWFTSSKLSARIQFLHSTEVSQPPQSSNFYHLHYVWFIVDRIKSLLYLAVQIPLPLTGP